VFGGRAITEQRLCEGGKAKAAGGNLPVNDGGKGGCFNAADFKKKKKKERGGKEK